MFTDHKTFNYEQPKMEYNKETGDVTIWDPKDRVVEKKKILNNVDEVMKMKQQLYEELGLGEDGLPKDATDPKQVDVEDLSQRLKKLRQGYENEHEYDPSLFYQFSRDFMRIDVGLMIQRPPIFLRMRENDIDFMKER